MEREKNYALSKNGNYNALVAPLLHGGGVDNFINYCIIYANITDTRHKNDICRTVGQVLFHAPTVSSLSRDTFLKRLLRILLIF